MWSPSVAVGLLIVGCAGLAAEAADQGPGALVIVGGGLSWDNAEVWGAFVNSIQDAGPVVIVPAASGAPVASAEAARADLLARGVAAERIQVARLATEDDPDTPEDESLWASHGSDAVEVARLAEAAAVWFTGGDQLRIAEVMLDGDRDTPALAALRAAHADGAVVGGTSAGAAMMGETMITRGDSLTALLGSAGEALETGAGLGFFEHGVVDQHFGERARLGRLAVALETTGQAVGWGVDEDTALVVRGDAVEVRGRGHVTVLRRGEGEMTLSLLSHGDRMDADTLAMTPAPWKSPTVGTEYREAALPDGGGMALPGQRLEDVLGEGLVDNAGSRRVERLSFDGEGRAVGFVFTQSEATRGWWGRSPEGVNGGRAGYAVEGVGFATREYGVELREIGK